LASKKRIVPDDEDAGRDKAGRVQEAQQAEDTESIKKSLEEVKEQAEKYLANWQRSEADFINYKRRNEQERAELASFAKADLMTNLLPVLDDFERALDNISDNSDVATWIEGIKLIYRKLKTVLEDHGLAEIEAEGEVFDPNFHEAVMCVEGEEGKVCEEIQRGYKMHDRLLRPSMVAVGKEAERTEPSED
jgi:molecular chaperone GrpE